MRPMSATQWHIAYIALTQRAAREPVLVCCERGHVHGVVLTDN